MTRNKGFKRRVRERMEQTGENYTTAARALRDAPNERNAMYTDQDKTAALEVLELAHGYALTGMIIPMRLALTDCKLAADSAPAKLAKACVDAEIKTDDLSASGKPTMEGYQAALSRAIDRALRGDWP